MTLFTEYARGRTLVATTPGGGRRLVAAMIRVPGGLVYADVYWRESSTHAFHIVRGTGLGGDGPWEVGDHGFDRLTQDDPLMVQFGQWRRYQRGDEGRSDRSEGEVQARRFLENLG